MRRRCEETGQAAAEYMGVLLLVGTIVFGLVASTNIGDRVAGAAERLVCQIAGGSGCGEPDPSAQNPSDPSAGNAPREVRDSGCNGEDEGDAVREEGDGPSGNAEADVVYDNLGRIDDYFADTFGRDSYDGEGSALEAWVNYCEKPGERTDNAFWDGDRMKFGEGFGLSLDITAHELAHAVTDDTADLDYECQPGALNESMSDIFGANLDAEDWEIGEDLPTGALRDMADPARYGQPAHVDDFVVRENDGTSDTDFGGVHTNSGIPNHAYFQLVERVGRDRAEQIVYRALTEHLESDSGFEDFRTAALTAARELYGAGGEEERGTNEAFAAVGLDGTWVAPEVEGCRA